MSKWILISPELHLLTAVSAKATIYHLVETIYIEARVILEVKV